MERVGFENAVTVSEPGVYAARSYSLIKPPRPVRYGNLRTVVEQGKVATVAAVPGA